METGPPEVWSTIERSLAFAAEAKRLCANSRRLRHNSKKLRELSAELLLSNSAFRRKSLSQNRRNPKLFHVEKLRLREQPIIR